MKAVTEALSPTRIKLTVEVPFDELTPSLDAAYKKLASQVKVQGFRPGKVPPRILDQRVGRSTILDEALQDALPRFYSAAVVENSVETLGRPQVDVTSFADGAPLVFTAEVDVRPEIVAPDYDDLPVSVDDAVVTDAEVDEQLEALRDRFAVLEGVVRAAGDGDYVSIDFETTVDGQPVAGAQATGLSHVVGSGALMPGLDEALVGMTEGDARTFTTALVGGEFAGRDAEVAVTVRGVKQKVSPALDDDFATTASEFDTLDELRSDIRTRIERIKRLQQGLQARDKALDALLTLVEVPLPDAAVDAEVESRMHALTHQLESAGLTLEAWLEAEGKTRAQLDAELREGAQAAVKSSLVLDAIANKEEVSVCDEELTDQVVRRAQRVGADAQAYADELVRTGQLRGLVSEIVRGKALALVLEHAKVTDASGRPVDLAALRETGVRDDGVDDDDAEGFAEDSQEDNGEAHPSA